MKTLSILMLPFALNACSTTPLSNSNIFRQQLNDYAIASCFAKQSNPYIQDQGFAWASALFNKMNVDIEVLMPIVIQIEAALLNSSPPLIRDDTQPHTDKPLILQYCSEIIHQENVKKAIDNIAKKS